MNIKYISVAAILSISMASALANDWYVVGSVGQSKAKDYKSSFDSGLPGGGLTSNMDDKDTGYKVQLGYKFNPNWAIEGGYVDLGKFNYNATYTGGNASGQVKVDGWNLVGVGTVPINDQFSLFGKLGFIDAKVEGSLYSTTPGNSGSASKTKGRANWGVGANYNVTKAWGLRAEWERFSKLGDSGTMGESDVDLLSVGAVFNF